MNGRGSGDVAPAVKKWVKGKTMRGEEGAEGKE